MDVEKALRTRHRANQISGNSCCLRQKLCLMACLFGQLHHQKQQAIAKRIAFAITSTVINIFLQRFVLDKKKGDRQTHFKTEICHQSSKVINTSAFQEKLIAQDVIYKRTFLQIMTYLWWNKKIDLKDKSQPGRSIFQDNQWILNGCEKKLERTKCVWMFWWIGAFTG